MRRWLFVVLLLCWSVSAIAAEFDCTIAASADDGYAGYVKITYPPSGGTPLFYTGVNPPIENDNTFGGGFYTISEELFRCDTSGIPDNATITGANLVVKVSALQSVNAQSWVCEFIPDSPLAITDWVLSPGSAALSRPLLTFAAGTTYTLGLTCNGTAGSCNGSPGISLTGFTKWRCGIFGGQPSGFNYLATNTFDDGTSIPILQVIYSLPTATPGNTATFTPAVTPTPRPTYPPCTQGPGTPCGPRCLGMVGHEDDEG